MRASEIRALAETLEDILAAHRLWSEWLATGRACKFVLGADGAEMRMKVRQ
jgi:hypothetical protein